VTAEHAVWLDLLSEAERRHLEPGAARKVNRRPDVLVVGGGIIGLATAAACQRAGLGSVVTIEREGRLGMGATGGAAGLLMPEAHVGVDPPWLVDLFRRSLGLWRELEATWPGGMGLVEIDWLGLTGDPAVSALVAAPRSNTRKLSPEEVEHLAPGLSEPTGGVLASAQARVNPLRAAACLAAGLDSVLTGVEAQAVTIQAERITAVTTSAGVFEPGAVVFATGNPPRLAGLEIDLAADFVKGHMLATEPSSARLPGSVSPVVSRIEDGRLLIGGSLDLGDLSPEVRSAVVDRMWQDLRTRLPEAADLRLTNQWCCFRPHHPDSLPVLDRVPGLRNAWLSTGHYKTGILMAPVTGQILARWLTSNEAPAEAAPLSASRPGLGSRLAARQS
jgi:glycine/D-amino acid oxidase-like deaminating enzyme